MKIAKFISWFTIMNSKPIAALDTSATGASADAKAASTRTSNQARGDFWSAGECDSFLSSKIWSSMALLQEPYEKILSIGGTFGREAAGCAAPMVAIAYASRFLRLNGNRNDYWLTATTTHCVGEALQAARKVTSNGPLEQAQKDTRRDFQNLVRKTTADRDKLSGALRVLVDSTDMETFRAIERRDLDHAQHLIRRRSNVLFSFPTRPRTLVRLPGDDESTRMRVHAIESAVRELLLEYDYVPGLKSVVDGIRRDSITSHDIHISRRQIFIHGPPGVGKTHFVRKLSQALGVSLVEEGLRTVADLDAIDPPRTGIGVAGGKYLFDSPQVTEKHLLTVIPHALVSSGHSNPIIFFDEAGELMAAASSDGKNGALRFWGGSENGIVPRLRNILQRNLRNMDSPWMKSYGISLDVSYATLVFAGNVLPTDPAILKRLQVLRFPPLTLQKKQEILEKAMRNAARTMSELGEHAVEFLEKESLSYVNDILEIDKASCDPGAHTLHSVAYEVVGRIAQTLLDNDSARYIRSDVLSEVKSEYGILDNPPFSSI
jgi:hypothetical protein